MRNKTYLSFFIAAEAFGMLPFGEHIKPCEAIKLGLPQKTCIDLSKEFYKTGRVEYPWVDSLAEVSSNIFSINVSRSGKRELSLYDAAEMKTLKILCNGYRGEYKSFSIGLKQLAIAHSNGLIDIYSCGREINKVVTLQGHAQLVSNIVRVGRNMLVTYSEDNSLKIWNLSSGECLKTIKVENCNKPSRCLVCLDENTIAFSYEGGIKICSILSSDYMDVDSCNSKEVKSIIKFDDKVIFSTDSNIIAFNFKNDTWLYEIKLGERLSLGEGGFYGFYPFDSKSITAVGKEHLACVCYEENAAEALVGMHLYNVNSGRLVKKIKADVRRSDFLQLRYLGSNLVSIVLRDDYQRGVPLMHVWDVETEKLINYVDRRTNKSKLCLDVDNGLAAYDTEGVIHIFGIDDIC